MDPELFRKILPLLAEIAIMMASAPAAPVCPVAPVAPVFPVAPVAPVVPVRAREYVNRFEKLFPSTVTGIVKTPFFVAIEVVTVTVNFAEVESLLLMEVLIPVGAPEIVPILAATCVAPLYAITPLSVLPASAAESPPANV